MMFKSITFVNGWPTTEGKNGATIYTDIVLHELSAIFPDIHIVSMKNGDAPGYRRRFKSLAHRIVGYATTLNPWGALKTIPADIESALPKSSIPSLLVINHISQGWATHYKLNKNFTHLVYIAHNMETDLKNDQKITSKSLLYFAHLNEMIRIKRYEQQLLLSSDLVVTISEKDCLRAIQLGAKRAVVVSPVSLKIPLLNECDGVDVLRMNSPATVLIVSSFYWSVKRDNLRKFLQQAYDVFVEFGVKIRISGRMSAAFERELVRYGAHIEVVRNPASMTPVAAPCQAGLLIDEVGGGFKLSTLTYLEERLPIFALQKAVAAEALPLVNAFDSAVDLAQAACRCALAPDQEPVVFGNKCPVALDRFRSHHSNQETLRIALEKIGVA